MENKGSVSTLILVIGSLIIFALILVVFTKTGQVMINSVTELVEKLPKVWASLIGKSFCNLANSKFC